MSTTLVTLLNNVSSVGVGSSHTLPSFLYKGGAHNVEVSGSFVGTIQFQGRIESTWYNLLTFTTQDLQSYSGVFSELRGNVSAYTSGTIIMKVRYGLEADYTSELASIIAEQSNIRNETTLLIDRLTAGRASLLDNLSSLDGSVANADNSIKNLRKELLVKNKL